MMISLLLSVAGLGLRLVAVCGVSSETITSVPWAKGSVSGGEQIDIHINLAGLRFERKEVSPQGQPANTVLIGWGEDRCDTAISIERQEYCKDCEKAAVSSVTQTIMSSIMTVMQMAKDKARMKRETDHNCQKTMTIVAGIISSALQLSAVTGFKAVCVDQVPTDVDADTKLDFELGAGSICFICACILKLISVGLHLIVPVPSARWKLPYEASDDPCPGVWPQGKSSA